MDNKPHMVEQVIKYPDGTETVISYRGVIENGVLTPDKPMEDEVKAEEAIVEETVEIPKTVEETVVESVEETA